MNQFLKYMLKCIVNRKILNSVILLLCTWGYWIQPVQAEGSRDLYPSSATGYRADLEWRTSTYGPTSGNNLKRRTLLQVYANAGEYILLGSSSMNSKTDSGGAGMADITIFGTSTGAVGNENLSNSLFTCSSQRTKSGNTNQGQISSRNQELAGPDTVPGGSVTNGYTPCYYQATSSGIYYVAFYGSDGGSTDFNGNTTSALNFGTGFTDPGGTSITAWDVTVRSSLTSTTNIPGRLFSDYLTLFTGNNGLPVNSTIYVETSDGYEYQTFLNGLDPDGFVIYANNVGFYNSDNKTPLYHDVLSSSTGSPGQLTNLQGGTNLELPTHVIFFNRNPDSESLIALNIPLAPTLPTVSNASYVGTAGGNNSTLSTGGTLSFTSNVTGVYQIVISQDGTFDPTSTTNRVLRGVMTTSGAQTISWDGKDNSGNYFPVGNNYAVNFTTHAGEYHFPLIDAENSTLGGPSFTLINSSNSLGNTTGFYDDRGYKTISGVSVGTPGTVLCGSNPPNTVYSNTITGFNTTTTQRAYGANPGSNTNVPCTGSFGDAKGLDIWTYVPSTQTLTSLNIVAPNSNTANLLLVKRITSVNGQTNYNGQDFTQLVHYGVSPHDTDDTNPNWPANYLKGLITPSTVQPGDELEYTIYFLSSGKDAINNGNICDLVPVNSTFVANTFTGKTPNTGLSGADQGIALAIGSTTPTAYLTNPADSDNGRFYVPNDSTTPSYCGSNTNGAIQVTIPSIPAATASGSPSNSYGFIRFHAKVK